MAQFGTNGVDLSPQTWEYPFSAVSTPKAVNSLYSAYRNLVQYFERRKLHAHSWKTERFLLNMDSTMQRIELLKTESYIFTLVRTPHCGTFADMWRRFRQSAPARSKIGPIGREETHDQRAARAYRRGVKPPPPLTCFFAFRIFARRVFTLRKYSV
jgi:hypothetical protein